VLVQWELLETAVSQSFLCLPSQSLNIIGEDCSNCQAIASTRCSRKKEPQFQMSDCVYVFSFYTFLFFLRHFLEFLLAFLEILMQLSPSRVNVIKTAYLWVYMYRNTEPEFVFCDMTSRNRIQRKPVFPTGGNSWRVVSISITIMQSVCRVTVSSPSINLVLFLLCRLPKCWISQ